MLGHIIFEKESMKNVGPANTCVTAVSAVTACYAVSE